MTCPDLVLEGYVNSVVEFYKLSHTEHLNSLKEREFVRYDGRGLSVVALAWGRVEAFKSLCPDLLAGDPVFAVDALTVRRAARSDAVEDYDKEREADWLLRRNLAKADAA